MAIKTIKQYESEKERDNFLKEMNIMSKLMHPNIVRLFGLVHQGQLYMIVTIYFRVQYHLWLYIDCYSDEPWMVLEYLPNGDLKQFLKVRI